MHDFARCVCLCLASLLTEPASTAPSSKPFTYAEDELCAQVQSALQVSDKGTGVLDALRLVFGEATDRKQADVAAKLFEKFDELADLILRCSTTRLLAVEVLKNTSVINPLEDFDPPRWQYGTWPQRSALLRTLWGQAKWLRKDDPARAARL